MPDPELPPWISSAAFETSNGELAWPPAHIEPALRAIGDAGLAILGGEIWRVVGQDIYGAVPDLAGAAAGVWHWETAPRITGEAWGTYCARCAAESVAVVAELVETLRQRLPPDLFDSLRVNVTWTAPADV